MNTAAEAEALRPLIRRDIVIDIVGNTLLGAGLYAWFGRSHWLPHLFRTETFIVLCVSTGLLNLIHLPARVRRMRRWQEIRDDVEND
jgi:hypothetical protein